MARHLMSCSVEQFAPTVGLGAVGVAVEFGLRTTHTDCYSGAIGCDKA
jgi:hypothetical protein